MYFISFISHCQYKHIFPTLKPIKFNYYCASLKKLGLQCLTQDFLGRLFVFNFDFRQLLKFSNEFLAIADWNIKITAMGKQKLQWVNKQGSHTTRKSGINCENGKNISRP